MASASNNDAPSFTQDDSLDEIEDLIAPSTTAPKGNGIIIEESNSAEFNPVYAIVSLIGLIYARVVYHCTYHRIESILGFILVCSLVLLVHNTTSGGSAVNRGDAFQHSLIDKGLSNIRSEYDLHIGDVDHWCLMGGNDDCPCEDPTEPSFRQWKGWLKAHTSNADRARAAIGHNPGLTPNIEDWDDDWHYDFDDDYGIEEMVDDEMYVGDSTVIDVLFLGDTFTEQRQGTASGVPQDDFTGIKKVFDKQFTKIKGGKYEALALGLAGDTSPNLLWRIMHGELPADLNPKVIWITIGTNDMLRTACSEEVVLLGILRVVEEIQKKKPSATVVINSILPLSSEHDGVLAYKSKYKELLLNKKAMKQSGRAHFDLWPSILSINEELEKFATNHTNVKYFDANKVFVEERSDGTYIVKGTMMPDNIHPSKDGHKAWNEAMIQKLTAILEKN